jgi:nucleoporin POM152
MRELRQAIKIWDILAPYFIPSPEPTWSSHLRPHSLPTAILWLLVEISIFSLISILRIPQLSPAPARLAQLSLAAVAYNVICWFVAEPASFWISLNLFGPPALGVQWYLGWWPLVKGMVWKNEGHISGVHKIRLLPFR